MGSFNFKDLLVWQKAMTYSEEVSQLIFFKRKKLISDDELNKLETDANEIAKMLNALINSIERSIN